MTAATRLDLRHSPAISRALPFALYIAFLALGPALGGLLPDARWLYALQVGVVSIALVAYRGHYAELSWPTRPCLDLTSMVLATIVGMAVFLAWINLDVPLLAFGHGNGFRPLTDNGSLDWGLVVVRIFGAALVVPIMEELFWRSLVMRWIDNSDFLSVTPGMVGVRSVMLSSLVFGFEHSLWFAGILAGLAYAWLYRRNGNLWIPVVAHGVTNLLLGIWVVATSNWSFW